MMRRLILCVSGLAIVILSRSLRAEITVSTDFEGGSAKVVAIDQRAKTMRLTPGGDPSRGWPCWWYVRIGGLSKGDKLTLEVAPVDAPLVGPGKNRGKPLAAAWCQPERAAVSDDGHQWRHTEQGEPRDGLMSYSVTCRGESVWLAWGPPFTPADSAHLVESLAKECRGAGAFELCRSNGGRPCPALRMKSGQRPDTDRPAVWIQARQHAWESGSSWVCRGAAEWLASGDSRAVALRERAEIVIVPIMDIDSTATGNGGKESLPQDHNRDWTDHPHHAEVAAAQKELKKLADQKRLALFIDLHNPGPGDKQPFFYCCPEDSLSEQGREHLERFLTLCRGEMQGPLALAGMPRTSGATYDPLWKQMSKNWVAAHAPPHTVAVTLETAWNTQHSTSEGYRRLGEQLGQAIEKFLPAEARP